jgi:hypothetical protein
MMHAYAYAMQMQCNYGAKHLRCYTKHHREAILVQPMTCHAKAVARGGGQEPAAPRGRLLPFGCLPASPCCGGGMEAS